MGKAQSLRAGGTWLLAGEVAEKACSWLRLFLLTRFISEAEVGLATVFIVVLGFFELLTDLGVHNLLLHAPDDDDPRLLRSVHAVMALRGIGLAAILFFAAPWLASFFYPQDPAQALLLGGVDRFAGGLRWFALVPLFRGFSHYDNNIQLKRQNYRPVVAITLLPSLVVAALAYPVVRYFNNYLAMLALILIQEGVKMLVTHLVALGWWRWQFSKEHWNRIVAYGTPLLLNGLFMYIYSLGDRTLISGSGNLGKYFGHTGYPAETWAFYTVAMQIVSAPVLIVARLLARIALPLMAQIQHDIERFAYRYRGSLALSAAGGAWVIAGLTLLGGAVAMVFGPGYRAAGVFMGPLALMQAIAMVKTVPTAALLARGDTRGTLEMTCWRSAAIVPIAVVAAFNWDMWWIPVFGAAGEAAALLVVYRRLARVDAAFRPGQMKSFVYLCAVAAVAMTLDAVLPVPVVLASTAAELRAWGVMLDVGTWRGMLASSAAGLAAVTVESLVRGVAAVVLCGASTGVAMALFPAMRNQVIRIARGRLASDRGNHAEGNNA